MANSFRYGQKCQKEDSQTHSLLHKRVTVVLTGAGTVLKSSCEPQKKKKYGEKLAVNKQYEARKRVGLKQHMDEKPFTTEEYRWRGEKNPAKPLSIMFIMSDIKYS